MYIWYILYKMICIYIYIYTYIYIYIYTQYIQLTISIISIIPIIPLVPIISIISMIYDIFDIYDISDIYVYIYIEYGIYEYIFPYMQSTKTSQASIFVDPPASSPIWKINIVIHAEPAVGLPISLIGRRNFEAVKRFLHHPPINYCKCVTGSEHIWNAQDGFKGGCALIDARVPPCWLIHEGFIY